MDAVPGRRPEIAEPSRLSIYSHHQIDQVAVLGELFDPQRGGRHGPLGGHERLTGVRVADVADTRGWGDCTPAQGLPPAGGLFPPGGPHVLCGNAFEREKLEVVAAREFDYIGGGDAHAGPGGVARRLLGQAVNLAAENAVRAKYAARFAKILQHHLAAGDVLEDSVGVNEVEGVVR